MNVILAALRRASYLAFAMLLITSWSSSAYAQTCDSGADLNPAAKSAIESAAQRYFSMSTQGDVAGLKANAIPAVAGNFTGIEQAVVDQQKVFCRRPAGRDRHLPARRVAAQRRCSGPTSIAASTTRRNEWASPFLTFPPDVTQL